MDSNISNEYYNTLIREEEEDNFEEDEEEIEANIIPHVNFHSNVIRSIESLRTLQSLGESTSSDYHEDIYGTTIEKKDWDVFRDIPIDDDVHGSEKFYERATKTMKLIAYILVFSIVLIGAVVSYGTLLFMTSQLKTNKRTPYCQLPNSNPDLRYEAVTNPQEQSQWMWAIFLTYITPEVFTIGRSLRIKFFKEVRKSETSDFLIALLFESLHTIGVALLVLIALPELDVIKGAMLGNCLCFAPAVISLFTRSKSEHRVAYSVIDVIAICAQATGFVVWPLLMVNKLTYGTWAIPIGLFLTSLGWWENYVDGRSDFPLIKYLAKVKDRLFKRRYFVYAFVPFFKMFFFFVCMLLADYLHNSDKQGWNMFPMLEYFISGQPRHIEVDTLNLTTKFFDNHFIDGSQTLFQGQAGPNAATIAHILATPRAALLTWTVQFLCTWMCYVTAKFACRICIQGFSFALPLNVAIPVTVTLLMSFCGIKENDVCYMKDMLPRYLFWICPDKAPDNIFTEKYAMWIWLFWLVSQTWITMHMWLPKCERLAPTEKLFVTPMYNGCFIAPSIALNRRRFEDDITDSKILEGEIASSAGHYETIQSAKKPIIKDDDQITNIIACATMWHETDEEMLTMFKSILRMDEDQSARRNAQKYLQIDDPDYYEFETQILFDDAFEISDEDNDENVINRFVRSAIRQVEEAAREVHHCDIYIRPPTIIPTPYGGRLVWTLPGKTQMNVHLKDKDRIRHRKRWSQVMYMYYLLGFRIIARPYDAEYKTTLAHNTYLLALDGDIDFKPNAVQLLVDLMKKNSHLGASCGRIHPVGSGMMVWYQKFEYAIGHWLQKATEHMIGCVLCSPGCFSLFRARALMDDNVMKTYTKKPSEARHYVQYDQGEDRWLCTLLLQQGYRVEYSAASDAYTHAPEGFAEFFNQRRRWVPSTMANILDLLQDSKRTVKINNEISTLYIIYQGMLMVGTILGPGTIFLMMIAAFISAFNVATSISFYLNAIPLLIFIIMCFVAQPKNQVLCAQILTCFYAMIMLAVMVGIFIQISYSGWASPTTFLTLLLPVTMITAAILHPLEFTCLLWGWLYWLVIPSMYLLLIIYSYMNMNNVSWGTREVQVKKTRKEMEEEKKKMEEEKKKSQQNMVLNFFGVKEEQLEGGFAVSCANLCSFLLCTHPKPKDEQIQLVHIQNSLDKVISRLELIEKSVDHVLPGFRRRSTRSRSLRGNNLEAVREDEGDVSEEDDESTGSEPQVPKKIRDPLKDPLWIDDKDLKGPIDYLPKQEIQFWKDLINTYLYPINEDKVEKARIMVELMELRNKVVFAFFMLNAIFIVIVLLLQINRDVLYINWPLGVTSNITWTDAEETVEINQVYQHMQPIGLIFMIFFAVVIVIQFIGMLFHRFETLSHILASTIIECLSSKHAAETPEKAFRKKGIELARRLQRPNAESRQSEESGSIDRAVGRRKTIHKIEKAKLQRKKTASLDQTFRERYMSLDLNREDGVPVLNTIRNLSLRRGTIQLLANRRNSTIFGSAAGSRHSKTSSMHSNSMQSNSMYEGTPRPSGYPTVGMQSVQLTQDPSGRLTFIGSAEMDGTTV